jgi:TPR repeat protein
MSDVTASIFISHASRDRRIAETICSALENRGLRCWLANRNVAGGENFQEAVVRAIRSAKVMLLIFTANANDSDEVKKELVLASQNRLIVIPLRVEDITPDDAFAYELATRQWIEMFDDWERGLERLVTRLAFVLPESMRQASEQPTTSMPYSNMRAGQRDSVYAPVTEGPSPAVAPTPKDNDAAGSGRTPRTAPLSSPPPARTAGYARKRASIVLGIVLALAVVIFLVGERAFNTTATRVGPNEPQGAQTAPSVPVPPDADKTQAATANVATAKVPTVSAVDRGDAALSGKDYADALRWYRLAADQGNAAGQLNVGRIYEHGWGVPADYIEALHWYRLAAAQGYASAQNNIGALYDTGHGVKQDYAEALRWYRLAADHGNTDAQNSIGALYDTGHGVKQDYAEALRWYRLAADRGDAGAQRNIAWLYENGLGVKQDYAEALRWYRLAADQGDAGAQRNIARLYENGLGVKLDSVQARDWMQKAADAGDMYAKQWLASH